MKNLIFVLLFGSASCAPEKVKTIPYEPYKPFSMVIKIDTFEGEIPKGRYTKYGRLIIKKEKQ